VNPMIFRRLAIITGASVLPIGFAQCPGLLAYISACLPHRFQNSSTPWLRVAYEADFGLSGGAIAAILGRLLTVDWAEIPLR
jgi:hypothetical protein